MSKRLLPAGVLLFLAIAAHADTPTPPAGYAAYKLVRTRNLFDPDRRPLRAESTTAPARTQTSSGNAKGPSYIALTGTMVTPDKRLAFFSGSQADFGKVVGVHEKIGDFSVSAISPTQVDLELHGKPVILQVGRQVGLDGASLVAVQEPAPAAASSGAASSGKAPDAAGADDVLRRMMERRQKEMSK